MGWSIGLDSKWNRDIGYGVPAQCDHPGCEKEIDRGLAHVCGEEPHGGNAGCGLFFCGDHLSFNDECDQLCECCIDGEGKTFRPSADSQKWINHKLNHESWADWRKSNPHWVAAHAIGNGDEK